MKVLILFLATALLFLPGTLHSSDHGWNDRSFMPSGLIFEPLLGNPLESRMAVQKPFSGPELYVDLGNTVDIVRWTYTQQDSNRTLRTITIGGSFFAYGYITSVEGSRLQVDAIDGFFGAHIVYTSELLNRPWKLRFRFLHQSAHMVDGRYDRHSETLIGDHLPVSFARDQIEFTTMHYYGKTRLGGGFGFVVHRYPENISPYTIFLAGDRLLYSSTDEAVHWYTGYFVRGENINSFTFTHSLTAGVKFGTWHGRGIGVALHYYNGLNFFGEYFTDRLDYLSIGFSFDFW